MALYARSRYNPCPRHEGKLTCINKQAVWYRAATIPIIISEYGSNSGKPRTFHETTTLHSPSITGVFSGGCVYELWQGSNYYGLTLLESRNAKITPGMASRRKEGGTIVETRQLDSGTLHIFQDFVNYKNRLAETRDVIASADDAPETVDIVDNWMDCLFGHKPSDDVVPESCVDWKAVERDVGLV